MSISPVPVPAGGPARSASGSSASARSASGSSASGGSRSADEFQAVFDRHVAAGRERSETTPAGRFASRSDSGRAERADARPSARDPHAGKVPGTHGRPARGTDDKHTGRRDPDDGGAGSATVDGLTQAAAGSGPAAAAGAAATGTPAGTAPTGQADAADAHGETMPAVAPTGTDTASTGHGGRVAPPAGATGGGTSTGPDPATAGVEPGVHPSAAGSASPADNAHAAMSATDSSGQTGGPVKGTSATVTAGHTSIRTAAPGHAADAHAAADEKTAAAKTPGGDTTTDAATPAAHAAPPDDSPHDAGARPTGAVVLAPGGTATATGQAGHSQAAGAAPASPSHHSAVLDQVLPVVPRLVTRGDGTQRLTLRLHPEELGEVRLTVTVRNNTVDVTLAAGSTAQEALRDGSPHLRALLDAAGHTTGQVVIRDLPQSSAVSTHVQSGGPGSSGPGHGGSAQSFTDGGGARGQQTMQGQGRPGSPRQPVAGDHGGTAPSPRTAGTPGSTTLDLRI